MILKSIHWEKFSFYRGRSLIGHVQVLGSKKLQETKCQECQTWVTKWNKHADQGCPRLQTKIWHQDLTPRFDAKTWREDLTPRLDAKAWHKCLTKTWHLGLTWTGGHRLGILRPMVPRRLKINPCHIFQLLTKPSFPVGLGRVSN